MSVGRQPLEWTNAVVALVSVIVSVIVSMIVLVIAVPVAVETLSTAVLRPADQHPPPVLVHGHSGPTRVRSVRFVDDCIGDDEDGHSGHLMHRLGVCGECGRRRRNSGGVDGWWSFLGWA